MRSLLSLLAALAVVGALAAGGYWLYQRISGAGDGNVIAVSSQQASLALANGTHYALTVDMRKGAELVHFQILPGHSETRSFSPGDYRVEGRISDPNTDPFSSDWSFQAGGRYNATFSRDNQGNAAFIIERAGAGAAPGGQQKK